MGSRFPRSDRIVLAAFAMIVLPACHSAPAGKPASITYNDVKTLPPETLRGRVLAQLGSIVSPAPPPPRWRPFKRSGDFNDTWLATRPRPADDGSFCTYDLIQMILSPDTNNGDRTRDTPMHAVGVAITTWFSPVGDDGKDCTQRDPASTRYFETDEPIKAGEDFDMLKDVLARLRSPKPGFSGDCSLMDR